MLGLISVLNIRRCPLPSHTVHKVTVLELGGAGGVQAGKQQQLVVQWDPWAVGGKLILVSCTPEPRCEERSSQQQRRDCVF